MPYINDLVKGGYSYYDKDDDLLYSGRNESKSMFFKSVRKDRKPKDIKLDRHNFMDNAFFEKFKIKGRSQTLFCTGDSYMSRLYNDDAYLIFPINNYQILWSDKITDMYKNAYIDMVFDKNKTEILKIRNDQYNKTGDIKFANDYISDPVRKEEYLIKLKKDIDKRILSTYHLGNVMKAIHSKNEIMLYTNKFIGLKRYDYDHIVKSYIDKFGVKTPNEKNLNRWWDIYGSALPIPKTMTL